MLCCLCARFVKLEINRRDAGGTPGRTSDPLTVHIAPRLPRKSGGDQGTPERRRRDPLAVHIVPHLPRKRGGDQGTPEGRQRDARACIRPPATPHWPMPATQKRRRPRDTGGTPEGRQGVHPTPWECTLSHACHAKAAETKGHRRDAGGTPGRTSDPLAVYIVPRLPRKSGGDQGTPEGRQRDARAYIRPPGSVHCPTPVTQKRRRPRDTGGTPEGRQGVHPTPWQCTLSHACHAKAAAETKGHRRDARGRPGRASDPLTVHIVPCLPRE